MIGYYVIVAVLLIYLHETNAKSTFNGDTKQIAAHLRHEKSTLRSLGKTIRRTISFQGNADNVLCDTLKTDEKLVLCEKMRLHFVDQKLAVRFYDFEYAASTRPVPAIVGSGDPLTCRDIPIKSFDMEKRMLWCEPTQCRNGRMLPFQEIEGFFLASGKKTGRVYAFRPPDVDSREVTPAGEMDDVEIILHHVPRLGASNKGS